MPWCPKCRFEYVPQLHACPECKVKLVAELPEEVEEEGEHLQQVLLCRVDRDRVPQLRASLERAGIPNRVYDPGTAAQTVGYVYDLAPLTRVYVFQRDLERAREVCRKARR